VRLVVLNHDLVANLHLASATTQLHTTVTDIESMREMDIFAPGDPDSTGTTDLVLVACRLPLRNRDMFQPHSE
jgi:hypothetical protein